MVSEAFKPRVRFSKAIYIITKYCINIMLDLVSKVKHLLAFPSFFRLCTAAVGQLSVRLSGDIVLSCGRSKPISRSHVYWYTVQHTEMSRDVTTQILGV